MALAVMAWVVAIPLLGAMTGLRSMTPMAVLALFAWRGNLDLVGSWGFWAAKPVTLIVFAVLAAGELIGDKLPMTPSRVAPFPLIARVIFGGLVGALCATGLAGSIIEGALLGAVSAVAGAYLGFYLRQWLVKSQGLPALPVALVEDAIAIGLSFVALGIITG